MKARSRSLVILSILFGYVLLQFIWWEILLVRQNNRLMEERQKMLEISIADESRLRAEVALLHSRRTNQTLMIVGEGTVFLLLLLYGIYKIRQGIDREAALNKQQQNFFLSVTHELKTPIAATKLQLQTLQRRQVDEPTRDLLVERALTETERLNTLIDNILLASSMEAGQFRIKAVKVDSAALIENTLQRYYQHELAQGIITQQLTSGLYIQADSFVFPSVLTNLIDNSIKYADEKPQIIIRNSKQGSTVSICVSDQGPGIPHAEKQKIFDRFYRSGNEENRSTKGTGLGLYIVRTLCQMHGARVSVKNNKPKGSVFEVQFNEA